MAYLGFVDILQQAEQLAGQVDGTGELPRVERNLRQVLEASNELWSRVATTGVQDVQGRVLLGSRGVDLPQLSQKLENLSARKTFEPLEPIPDSDIVKFLRNERENAILTVLDESHKKTFNAIEKKRTDHMFTSWRLEQVRTINGLLGGGDDFLDVTVVPERSTVNETVIPGRRSALDNLEMAYAREVTEYNTAVVRGLIRPSLVQKFSQVASASQDKKATELWEMVTYMVEVPVQPAASPLTARSSPVVKSVLISQAKKYLEERYKMYMQTVVMSNLNVARRGGVPGTFPLVRSFVNIKIIAGSADFEDGNVDDQPVWPLIYYCLRCGDIKAALYCAKESGSSLDDIRVVLEELHNSADKKISVRTETQVRLLYRRGVRNAKDPFKRIVYCILGSCDVTDSHPDVVKSSDDYIWLKLSQISDGDAELPSADRLSFAGLQTQILEEYGETYFHAHDQPYIYFQVLFLTGQFEAAIEFLYRTGKLQCHAVHIALALHELNLLGTPFNSNAPLLSIDPSDYSPARRLNLARLVMLYVRKFESTDPKEALQYYYFLRNMEGPSGENLFMLCVSSLTLESREFDLLLGRIEHDGCRTPGLIDAFQGVQADSKKIIELIAKDSEKKGLLEDAMKLYDLAGNQEKVLSILVTLLGQVVSQPSRPGSLRYRLSDVCRNISSRYLGQEYTCTSKVACSFVALRNLMFFFDQYHNEEHQQALKTVSEAKVIPMHMGEIDERIRNFSNFSEEVSKNIPDVLIATMNILYGQYNKLRDVDMQSQMSKFVAESGLREKYLKDIRETAHAIATFSGTVPYQMPGDTNARLVQMEILMH